MTDQKVENLLNLALDATEEEREKSLELDVGYNPIDKEWDLIIKYSGELDQVRGLTTQVVELLNEYAIVTVKESLIEQLSFIPEVEYVEKPKRLFFEVVNGKRVSCIDAVQDAQFSLYGRGTLIGIVDSGIEYENADFRNEDGTTRINALWDQTIKTGDVSPPNGYLTGAEYTEERINDALRAPTIQERRALVPSEDVSGHGTAVAGIAAGNGRNSGGLYAGVAPESTLLVVKLGSPRKEGFPRTTELMQGIDFVMRKAIALQKPVAINISFGNTYGAHDGTSLVERYIEDVANLGKTTICIGTGNEAASAGHTSGILQRGEETRIQLAVQEREPTINVQIWKSYTDEVDISLISPSGVRVGPFQEILGPQRFAIGKTELLLYYGEPSPYSVSQEIFIDFIPKESYITSGVWQIVLQPKRVVDGTYNLWLPSEGVLNRGTGFLYPTEGITLTIPATAGRIVAVGAYDATTFAYADFSGRGVRDIWSNIKPDVAAPGVNVTTTAVGGGYEQVTGTSFAAPFATGGAVLLMEWGIVRGNDPFLYDAVIIGLS